MGNYQDVLAVRKEISAQGLHFGSAEAENAQYLDSISGKLNALKETWTSIITTIVKSEEVKGILDVFISISEVIDGVIKQLDSVGMLYPALFTGLVSGFKGLKTLAGFGDSGESVQFRIVGESLKMVKTTASQVTPIIANMWGELSKGNSVSLKGAWNEVKNGVKASKDVSSSLSGVLMPSLAKAGKAILSVAGTFAGFAVAIATIKLVGKAWQEMAHGLKNSEKEILSTIESIEGKLSEDRSNLDYLNGIEDRYNELIKKKKEYSNTPIEDRSDEQIADLQELQEITNQLAKMFPELVVGYDQDGSPILLMADDMQTLKDRTQEQIDLQNELLRIQREELADNARKRVQDGEFFGLGSGIAEQMSTDKAITNSLYDSLKGNEREYTKAVLEGNDRRAKKLRETIETQREQLGNHYQKQLELYSEYISEEAEIQKSAYDQVQVKDGYNKLTGEKLSSFQNFFSGLNWAGMDESQYNSWVNSFDKVIELAQKGSPKLKEWSDALQLANDKYNTNGNVDEYSNSLSSLAKVISDELGIDYSTVFSGLEHMGKPLTDAQRDLQSFLETYKTSRYELLNGDDFAKKLADQYQAISDVINNVFGNENSFKADGVTLTFEAVAKISNMDTLPKQVTDLTSQLQKGGVTKQESEIILDLMYVLKEGNTAEARAEIDRINKQLNEMGLSELQIDINTVFNETGTKEAKEKLSELEKALNSLREEKSLKLLIDLVGEDKAKLYQEIMENLPVDAEYTNKFIIENQEALSAFDTWKEVQEWLNSQPTEFKQTYGLEVATEGVEKTKEVLEEANEQADELSEDINLSVNDGELQGSVESFNQLIEYSSKLKDGEYKLSFTSDTGDSIAQINNLKDTVNELSRSFSSLPSVTLKIETSVASKNVTGLRDNIKRYSDSIGGIKTAVFRTDTAQGSKNVTGLKKNVSDYVTKYGGKNFSTKFSTQTALASQNVTGLRNNVSSYVDKYGGKTFTTTFKVTTSYVTTGTPTNQSAGAKPGGVSADSTMGEPIPVAQTYGLETAAAPSQAPAVASSRATASEGEHTPMPMNWSNPVEVINQGFNYFVEIENVISNLNGQLKILQERMENSFGSQRIEYLKQYIKLLEQQRNAQSTMLNELNTYQSKLKSYLSGKGFNFDAIGNITNYHTKLVGMERELSRLEEISNKENATDAQKKAYENYRKQVEETKKVMDEYLQTTFTDIPNAKAEWESLGNEIENTKDAIEEARRELEKFVLEAKIETLVDGFRDLQHELNIIDKLLKNASGMDKLDLMEKRVEILKKQQQELMKQSDFYSNEKNKLQKYLGGLGFNFDNDGDITNYAKQLEYLANNSKDFELIQEKLEEYFEYQNNTLPDIKEEWLDLENAIKDALKEQLNITADMEKKITDIYKKQIQDRIEAMNKETDAKIKELKKQQDAYNKYRDEVDYDNEYEEKLGTLEDLQRQLDIAMKDTSLSGQKRVKELQKMLADAQKELEKLTQNKIDKDVNDMFDKEQERLEEENNKAVEDFENEWSDAKIAEMVAQALGSGVFTTIEGEVISLEDALVNFATETGELFGVLGQTIKDELITNLGVARETVRDLAAIMKELDLSQVSAVSNVQGRSLPNATPTSNFSVNFSSPLLVVEGGVNSENIGDLERIMKDTEQRIVKNIMDSINN